MRLRGARNTKNRLSEPQSTKLELVRADDGEQENGLRFRTRHPTKPCFVDLTCFDVGRERAYGSGVNKWLGAYQGRPELIRELTPALVDRMSPAAEKTTKRYIEALTAWWRLLDQIESRVGDRQRITSVLQLTEIHRQAAADRGLARKHVAMFLAIVNQTRNALGQKSLYWKLPEKKEPTRHLAPKTHFDLIRRTIKQRWFKVLDRWERTEQLLVGVSNSATSNPDSSDHTDRMPRKLSAEDTRLRMNYQHFLEVAEKTGRARPSGDMLYQGMTSSAFSFKGFSVREMLAGFYPNGDDIRVAFHLCLARTGWNPAVLLSLDVNTKFIETHPMDDRRYVLRGTKDRAGGAEQIHEGLFKSQGSAGSVLQKLQEKTAPLRTQLQDDLAKCKKDREKSLADGLALQVASLDRRIMELESAVRSPWIYASTASGGDLVARLTDTNYGTSSNAAKGSYLQVLVREINSNLPPDQQVSHITASDFRDGFAYDIYQASGGSILAVYKALSHRSIESTSTYLRTTLLKAEHQKLFGTFSQALWSEIEVRSAVDPTVLAKWSRDGSLTVDQRNRLNSYRNVMMTRLGTGCRDPFNPPKHIDPNFIADGKSMCHVQRCTLCVEHAVIMPESMQGLCKRLVELRHLKSQMSARTTLNVASLDEELKNLELVLLAFDEDEVRKSVLSWTNRIESGEYRGIEFDGIGLGNVGG